MIYFSLFCNLFSYETFRKYPTLFDNSLFYAEDTQGCVTFSCFTSSQLRVQVNYLMLIIIISYDFCG
jgi:hypothetical protein